MTHLFVSDALIEVRTNSHGQPTAFEMDGHRSVVERTIQEWEVDTDWWAAEGHAWRRQYAVITCDEGVLCVLSHDVLSDAWQLEKVHD